MRGDLNDTPVKEATLPELAKVDTQLAAILIVGSDVLIGDAVPRDDLLSDTARCGSRQADEELRQLEGVRVQLDVDLNDEVLTDRSDNRPECF